MAEGAVIQGEHWRIGVLTESMIRMEWSPDGGFEDRCSQMAINRSFVPPSDISMTVQRNNGTLIVDTPALRLSYDCGPFTKEGLSIAVKGMDGFTGTWHYGDAQRGNLGGTARTLDGADGPIPVGDGLASRDGWAVLDDSRTNVMVPDGHVSDRTVTGAMRMQARPEGRMDLYFFGYGHRYNDAVRDFYRLSGPAPLLPRFALGNWWSRYHPYSADEYIRLMDRFRAEGIPFTTSVLDMDWHLTRVNPRYGSGWTGYTWNTDLFPDPAKFLSDLHDRGMRVTLNVHPRDGVRAYEKPYGTMARAMGIDPASGEAIEFDMTDPAFVVAYFDMHHDLERQGVDFWWIDWQQGGITKQAGLDPLWMLNRLHFLDSARRGRWPLTFSRYAGPGSHRYPVGFSGDTVVSWRSLRFQPHFTAMASNIGYGWWSHDIGGHMEGVRDEELEARWYQLGAFSPINRLHSTASAFNGKEPWNFHEPIRSAMIRALRLRQSLIPYLYTMNWRNARDGDELISPMYWLHPDVAAAYEVPDEYRFGSQLVVAPVVEPIDRRLLRAKTKVWLPQGVWFDFFSGRRYVADRPQGVRFLTWSTIERIPAFAPAGGIVPLQDDDHDNRVGNPSSLSVVVFPGADGEFSLREDDGRYADNADLCSMHVADTSLRFDSSAATVTIGKARGDAHVVPRERHWTVILRGVSPCPVRVDGSPCSTVSYDSSSLSMSVDIGPTPTSRDVVVTFPEGLHMADDSVEQDLFDVCMDAQIAYPLKDDAYRLVRERGIKALPELRTLAYEEKDDRGAVIRHSLPSGILSAFEEILLRV
jgi:alpha-glucosidase (family GH31 glycosyl hydrolase)